jgi:hypothetical protein
MVFRLSETMNGYHDDDRQEMHMFERAIRPNSAETPKHAPDHVCPSGLLAGMLQC